MKKSMIACICLIAMALTACAPNNVAVNPNPNPTNPPAGPTDPAVTAPPQTPTTPDITPSKQNMYSASMPIRVESQTAADGTVLSTFSSQQIDLIIPDADVAQNIKNDFYSRIDMYRMDAEDVHQRAEDMYHNGGLPAPLTYDVHYDVMRIDQGILSLYGELMFPLEGARPTKQCVSACYNLITGDVLTLGSILYHANAKNTLRDLLITELGNMREDKGLSDNYVKTVNDIFSKDESTLENFYFSDAGLCFYFSPYQIASGATGPVIATIPYQKLINVIGNEYFPEEKTYSSGTLSASAFTPESSTKYQQFAEILSDQEGTTQKILLTADSIAQNIRIHRIIRGGYAGIITDTKIIFASNILSATDAILFDGNFSNANPLYALTYSINNETKVFYFTYNSETSQVTLTETDDPILMRYLSF